MADISIALNLKQIYDLLCPACREALLDKVSAEVATAQVREGLRAHYRRILLQGLTNTAQVREGLRAQLEHEEVKP